MSDTLFNLDDVEKKLGDRRFMNILDQIKEMHLKKSADYGTDEDIYANVRASEEWGIPAWQGAMIRACDKVSRLQTYANKGVLQNEGVRDSFMDLASYAIIALVLFDEAQYYSELDNL